MRTKILSVPRKESIIDGLPYSIPGFLVGVWNTVTLDLSATNKKVEIHLRNNRLFINTEGSVRQIDDLGSPVGTGLIAQVGFRSSTSVWVTANKNAQIQIFSNDALMGFTHVSTLK